MITIDHKTDESDADDLSEVSKTSANAMTKGKFQGLLASVTASQQKAAEAIDTLATQVGEMMTDQVNQAAATVVTGVGHVQGLQEITQAFDKVEVGLILAMGVRKFHEYQCLKGSTGGGRHNTIQSTAKEIWPQPPKHHRMHPGIQITLSQRSPYKGPVHPQ